MDVFHGILRSQIKDWCAAFAAWENVAFRCVGLLVVNCYPRGRRNLRLFCTPQILHSKYGLANLRANSRALDPGRTKKPRLNVFASPILGSGSPLDILVRLACVVATITADQILVSPQVTHGHHEAC